MDNGEKLLLQDLLEQIKHLRKELGGVNEKIASAIEEHAESCGEIRLRDAKILRLRVALGISAVAGAAGGFVSRIITFIAG